MNNQEQDAADQKKEWHAPQLSVLDCATGTQGSMGVGPDATYS